MQRFVIDQVLIKTSKMFHRMLRNVLYPGVFQVRIEHSRPCQRASVSQPTKEKDLLLKGFEIS